MIYLNSAHQSRTLPKVLRQVQALQRKAEKNPGRWYDESRSRLDLVKKKVARFFGIPGGGVYFRSSMTEIIEAYLQRVHLRAQSEILVADFEYTAIQNLCHAKARRDGLRVRYFNLPRSTISLTSLTGERLLGTIVSQINSSTSLLVLSHIFGYCGLTIPLEDLLKRLEKFRPGLRIVVDGAYSAGAIDLSLRKYSTLDLYGINFHKWMMGPKGTAVGWLPNPTEDLADIDMAGCRDFAPFLAIPDTLAFWSKEKSQRIFKLQHHCRELLRKKFRDLEGWSPIFYRDKKLEGPFASVLVPRELRVRGKALKDDLRALGLEVGIGQLEEGPILLFSPTWGNQPKDIEQAISCLRKIRADFKTLQ